MPVNISISQTTKQINTIVILSNFVSISSNIQIVKSAINEKIISPFDKMFIISICAVLKNIGKYERNRLRNSASIL